MASIPLHDHGQSDAHEFHYFMNGEGSFWNAGVEQDFGPGSIFYSRPTDAHRAVSRQPEARFRMYYLSFTIDDDADGLIDCLQSRFTPGTAIAVGQLYAPLFEEIRHRRCSSKPLVRRSADFKFMALLCDLVGGAPAPVSPTAVKYVEEALALMQASIHTSIDLDDFSLKLGIDKAYFVRLFKQTMGVPPMRYLLGLRIDTAKQRLLTGDENLRVIALDLGFHDEFHFSHQFKSYVGLSPHTYRHSQA